MKIFNIVLCIIFVLSAALQYNDPDPYIWMPIYLYPAVLCYLATKNKFYPNAYLFGIAFSTIYALWLFFDKTGVLNWARVHDAENIAQSMKATKPWIEETREFFGLLIIIIALMANLIHYKRRKAY
jgi:hypothetical protein